MADPADILARKLKEHSRLTSDDVAELEKLTYHRRSLRPNEDFIRQGDRPNVAALVLSGMVARYHLLKSGGRQYLSFHIKGDLPDAQSLFLERMDHAVCADRRRRTRLHASQGNYEDIREATLARFRNLARNTDRCRDLPRADYQQQRAAIRAPDWRTCSASCSTGRAPAALRTDFPAPRRLARVRSARRSAWRS